MKRLLAAAIIACACSAPAKADWHVASSEHFVIYADDRASDVQRFAEILERYHAALELMTERQTETPSPSNRVTIYAVGGERDMRRLSGSNDIAGFYVPRAGGSSAFVQDVRLRGREPDFTLTVLLHEYAHHVFMSSTRFAQPRWLSEGSAEFFASAMLDRDDNLEIGRPANHRYAELFYGNNSGVRDLLGFELLESDDRERIEAFYGRSWLLYHYLTFNEERRGQLRTYWEGMRAGLSSVEAGEAAFGDLDALDSELEDYQRQRRILMIRLGPERLPIGPIEVRQLSEGMDETMPLIIRSKRGVTREQALELLPDMREMAERHPEDAGVLSALAEAEYDAGNDAEAIAAADAAIARDPSIANAYVQKGYALFRMAEEAEDQEAAYETAMGPFYALNAIENDHPLPLIYLFRSFAGRGVQPSEHAQSALFRASELAPFDKNLTLNTAMMLANAGNISVASAYLEPLALDPHGGGLPTLARDMIEAMEGAEQGTPFYFEPSSAEPDAVVSAEGAEGEESGEEPGEEPGDD